jgi:hypothetical protein
MRDEARYYLSQKADVPFAEIYRAALADPHSPKTVGILAGLGETGEKRDAVLLLNFTKHPFPKIRKGAVKAVAKLAAQKYSGLFQTMIEDDSPRVSRESARALLQCRYSNRFPALWLLFKRTEKSHIKKSILLIAGHLSKWESISYFLEALTEKEDAIRDIANQYVNRWLINFNRSFVSPTPGQKERLRALLRSQSVAIGAKRLEAIEFNMKSF